MRGKVMRKLTRSEKAESVQDIVPTRIRWLLDPESVTVSSLRVRMLASSVKADELNT